MTDARVAVVLVAVLAGGCGDAPAAPLDGAAASDPPTGQRAESPSWELEGVRWDGSVLDLGRLAPASLTTFGQGELAPTGTTLERGDQVVMGYAGPADWPELVVYLLPRSPQDVEDISVGYVFTPERTWLLFDPAAWSDGLIVTIDGVPAERVGGLASLPGDHAWATAMLDDRTLDAESEAYFEALGTLYAGGATIEELEAWAAANPQPDPRPLRSSSIAISTAFRPPDVGDVVRSEVDDVP